MNQDPEIYNDKSQKYQLLLEQIENLFKRQNLCCNTYIYKQIKAELILPLYVILDQKNIAALRFQKQIVIQAIEESGLAKVFNNRQVKLYQFPTVKIHFKQHDAIKALQAILEEKSIIYKLSKRPETNEYINLTIFSQNIIWLEKLIENIGKQIVFQRVRLLNDMKIGVDKIRKLKFYHAKLKTAVGKATYSLANPPKKFIRKALQSSDSQQQESVTKALGKFSKIPKKINQKTINTVQQFPRLLQ